MSVSDHLTNKDTWLRGLFIVIFAVIFYVAALVIVVVVIFQFITKLFTGKVNAETTALGRNLSTFIYQILLYVTFVSDKRPYPFSPWPPGPTQSPGPSSATKKTATKITKKPGAA